MPPTVFLESFSNVHIQINHVQNIVDNAMLSYCYNSVEGMRNVSRLQNVIRMSCVCWRCTQKQRHKGYMFRHTHAKMHACASLGKFFQHKKITLMEWKLWKSLKGQKIKILQLFFFFLANDGIKPLIILQLRQKCNLQWASLQLKLFRS